MPYDHIDAKPITGALGAEIFGVHLREPLSDVTFNEIKVALHEHLVIFFRDQDITGFVSRFEAVSSTYYMRLG